MTTSKTDDRILVIGYDSAHHGNDATSRIVVEAIAAKRRRNVVAISATQLVPELATVIASARAVIFVDAAVKDQKSVEVRELTPACPLSQRFCDTGPRELLALTRNCYGHPPLAWLVSVPGREIGAAVGSSAEINRHVHAATAEVEQLIHQLAEHEVGQT